MFICGSIKGLYRMITLQNICKDYGRQEALKSITLELFENEILAIVGPSGCGKTTLLRLVAGLEIPDTGSIQINGVDASTPTKSKAPNQRNLSLIFQDLALWPHMTVTEHLSFALGGCDLSKEEVGARISEIIVAVALNGYANRYPNELSGGEQQRLAIARALAPKPKYLLMDEPFSNLDTIVKVELIKLIMKMKVSLSMGIIFVTHNIEEAFSLADRIAIMNGGTIVQIDTGEALRKNPKNEFVRQLLQTTWKTCEF